MSFDAFPTVPPLLRRFIWPSTVQEIKMMQKGNKSCFAMPYRPHSHARNQQRGVSTSVSWGASISPRVWEKQKRPASNKETGSQTGRRASRGGVILLPFSPRRRQQRMPLLLFVTGSHRLPRSRPGGDDDEVWFLRQK